MIAFIAISRPKTPNNKPSLSLGNPHCCDDLPCRFLVVTTTKLIFLALSFTATMVEPINTTT